jgi:tetratricopeptide (TPR) repeat protein
MSVQNWEEVNARAITHHQQGWLSEAASIGEDALELAEEIFGRDHLNTAESLKNLALIYFAQAQDAEAAIFEQTLAIRDKMNHLSDSLESVQSLNRVVLLNLSKNKYSRAESLMNRALKIRKEVLGQDHPDVLESIGNLAALYNKQGRNAEAKSLLKSVRSRDAMASISIGIAEAEESSKGFIEGYESRRDMRHNCRFPVRISKEGLDTAIRGVTENLSQIGTFIKTNDFSAFKINDEVGIYIFIPSLFSPKCKTVGMQGKGLITRVDEEKQGLAVQFKTNFKAFDRIGQVEVPEEVRYKRVADYISADEDMESERFLEKHPQSFLIERVEMGLDEEVIFQLRTHQLDNPDVLSKIGGDTIPTSDLQARVLEISKRKIESNHGVIRIGRAANNDIVLYNKLISKSHAFMFFLSAEQDPYLVDLGSANGTFLNDEKMVLYEMNQLRDGDQISFGPEVEVRYLSTKAFYDFLHSIKRPNASASLESTDMISDADRRKYPRAEIDWPITLKTTIEGVTRAQLGNLSAGGAYIHCDKTRNPGELIVLLIKPPDRQSLEIRAEVVWTGNTFPPGMGVRFLEISENDCRFLHDVVSDHLKAESKNKRLADLQDGFRD